MSSGSSRVVGFIGERIGGYHPRSLGVRPKGHLFRPVSLGRVHPSRRIDWGRLDHSVSLDTL